MLAEVELLFSSVLVQQLLSGLALLELAVLALRKHEKGRYIGSRQFPYMLSRVEAGSATLNLYHVGLNAYN